MAILTVVSLTTNPIRATIDFNGSRYTLEYPNKAAVLEALGELPDSEARLELALMLVVREWRKIDPNLNNLAGLVGKICVVPAPVVTIT